MTMRATAVPVATLDDVLQELHAIRLLLERQQPECSLNRTDRATLARLLPAIGGAMGSKIFSSAEVCEHTAPAVRLVCEGLSVRRLGKLFARAADSPVSGYMVQRQGTGAGAVLRRVVQVPEFPRLQKPFHSSRVVDEPATIDDEE
jgi:hypothetical protein